MRRKKTFRIYKSWRQILATFLVLLVPFLFLLFFSTYAKISANILLENTAISLARMLIAYIIAALLGFSFAIIFYRGKRGEVALPVFDLLQSFPTSAALPLAALLWGESNTTVIIFLVTTIIWPILFSVLRALQLAKHEWEESVEIAGLKGFDYLRRFLIPICIPALVTGSMIGVGEGWGALVATEIIVGVRSGLGTFFRVFAADNRMTALGILGFLIIIFTINRLVWLSLLNKSHLMMEE